MEKIQVLLAGICGYGARYLEELLKTNDDVFTLAGVVDPFAAFSPRAKELKARSIPVYQDTAEFFAEKTADLSVISSPIHTHYHYVRNSLENGSNVLCEKPVAGTPEELEELIAIEKKTSLFAAVGFQDCFSRDILAVKKDILDGLFGKPLDCKAIRLNRRGTKYYKRNGWAGKLSYEGRVILDSPLQNANSHDLHNLLFLLGDDMRSSIPVESAEAELWQIRPGIENYDAAAVRFTASGGVNINFYTAHCVEEKMEHPHNEVRFEKALLKRGEPPDYGFIAYFHDGRIKSYIEEKGAGDINIIQKLSGVFEAIRSGVPPVCTLETVRSHAQCVNLVQRFSVKKTTPEKLIRQGSTEDGDIFYYVPGLYGAFFRAYEKNVLPSEIGYAWS